MVPAEDLPVDPLPVFADVDTGVDDAMALVYLLASADAELVGVASSGGNVAVEQVCINNLGLLELCGADRVPVAKGAGQPLRGPVRTAEGVHGDAGLGYAKLPTGTGQLAECDAATAWVRAARAHPGQLIGVATAPLTNLALALRAEPALPKLLRRLAVMGGAYQDRGDAAPVAEFNVGADPEAAAEVLAAFGAARQLPILCGLELTENVAMTPAHLRRLAAVAANPSTVEHHDLRPSATNPLLGVLEDAVRFYFETHHARGHGYRAYLHDPLAAAAALDPSLVVARPAAVAVELDDASARGATIVDWGGRRGREPNAMIGVDVDPAVFFDRFIERVGGLARHLNGRRT